ncbi:UDP-N-acetylmuramate:L-alanyl-gamma-D-glutamyl-meso-diaminopimelate ligase [Castellaniella hirudinis]|uniref:UDP-N-acetylmuramate:L-alanyl-gamma-D-glutamyl- meso-diaminopimelate ligase n=1 Tax=Castellaniella hirudinis TaxID=1144617 RepID=UPI0039C0240A
MHVHILGICGTFMGGLALIARAAGHRVTGCDAGVYPPMSTQLNDQGIQLIEGFEAAQIRLGADLYIIGNVVSRGNPLMEAILDQGLPYTSGPQWLADHILPGQHVLAVAGTHGKTTTSALLAWIFQHAGQAANFLIGGVAPDLGVSARYQPQRRHFVIEADEYDTAFFDKRSKFVHYRPRTAILNNLEFDHADIFPDLAAIEAQFHHLVRTIPAQGLILRPADCPPLDRVLARGCWTPVETFGPQGRWQAQPDPADDRRSAIAQDGQILGVLDWDLAGQHNRGNALAAIAAAHHAGIPVTAALDALHAFQGVRRRLELRGIRRGVAVYDDFAHHPSAIATTVQGLRQRIGPQGRILAVLEPRSNTMKLGAMAERLPDALAQADQVYCYGQISGKQALGWDPAQVLAPLGDKLAWSGHDLPALVAALCAQARDQDHILVMSNGGFGGIHTLLLDALASPSQ